MNTKQKAIELSRQTILELLECGTKIDEQYRLFRELRILEDESPNFAKALIDVEHAFFMVVMSMNILKDQLRLLETASKKQEI